MGGKEAVVAAGEFLCGPYMATRALTAPLLDHSTHITACNLLLAVTQMPSSNSSKLFRHVGCVIFWSQYFTTSGITLLPPLLHSPSHPLCPL
jgi:hypothetical protein